MLYAHLTIYIEEYVLSADEVLDEQIHNTVLPPYPEFEEMPVSLEPGFNPVYTILCQTPRTSISGDKISWVDF